MVSLSEAFVLGEKLGVDLKLLSEVINCSSGRSWSSEVYNPVPGILESAPASNEYRGGFSNKLVLKDLRLALDLCDKVGFHPIQTSIAMGIYEKIADTEYYKEKDFSSVFKYMKDLISKQLG
jgi:3-hydroxyisobutyrate dehydrogenase